MTRRRLPRLVTVQIGEAAAIFGERRASGLHFGIVPVPTLGAVLLAVGEVNDQAALAAPRNRSHHGRISLPRRAFPLRPPVAQERGAASYILATGWSHPASSPTRHSLPGFAPGSPAP